MVFEKLTPDKHLEYVTVESRDVIPRYEILHEMLCAEAKHLECREAASSEVKDLECPKGDTLLRRTVLWTE